MYCRGEKTREQIVKEYDLKPVAHVKLLNNKTIKSETGNLLTDSYYLFAYKRKNDKEYTKTFFCGSHAAEHFINLIKAEKLPLFNPFKNSDSSLHTETKGGRGSDKKKWNETAKQLYEAINLIIICWDTVPGIPLMSIKGTIEKFYFKEPFLSEVKGVNTIIKKDFQKRTLSKMISDLRSKNDNIREFDFSLLNKMLKDNEIESAFG